MSTVGTAAVFNLPPRPLLAHLGDRPEPVPVITDPRIKAIVQRGLDAASSAGAAYADVRLVHTRVRGIGTSGVRDDEGITVGVRALADGYWGFASGPIWSPDEMVRLGREAVFQAKTNALGKSRAVHLAPVSRVVDGHWDMPVRINPFEAVHPDEVRDYLMSLEIFLRQVEGVKEIGGIRNGVKFTVQDKAFGALTGSYITQQTFRTEGVFDFVLKLTNGKEGAGGLDSLTPAGLGWELYRDQPLRDQILQEIEEIKADSVLPVMPVDVGRYDIIFDASSMTRLLSRTVGAATELDRAMGYEANAGGTSYLNDPMGMVGTFQVASQGLTVTGNRSAPGAVATTKWDDEGCPPVDFTVVRNGVLTDFQTTRESAGWLADYYTRTNMPLRSYGCAYAPDGVDVQMSHTANLTMAPGTESLDFEGLIANMSKGLACRRVRFNIDFQQLNGLGIGKIYEIVKGRRTAILADAGVLFRAPELLKNITAVGGEASLRRYGLPATKGEPPQRGYHSVTACPTAIREATIVDYKRKA